jgi:DHA1 family inner membrane transport protein
MSGRLPFASLLVLAAGTFVALSTELLPVSLLPRIGHSFGVSEGTAGTLVSVYAIVVTIGSIPLGVALASRSRRWTLAILAAGFAIANVGFALSTNFVEAVVFRAVGGGVHAAFFGIIFVTAAEMSGAARRGVALAIIGLGVTCGLAFGVPLGTALGAVFGWRDVFLFAGGLLLVASALFAIVLPRSRPEPQSGTREQVKSLARRPVVASALLITLLLTGHYLAFTYIATFLHHAGLSQGGIAAAFFAFGVCAAGGSALAGIAHKVAPHLASAGAALLISGALALLGLGVQPQSSLAFTFVGMGVWGLGYGALVPLVQSIGITSFVGAERLAPSVINSSFNLAIFAGATVGAAALSIGPPTIVVLAGAALAAFSAALLAHQSRTRHG